MLGRLIAAATGALLMVGAVRAQAPAVPEDVRPLPLTLEAPGSPPATLLLPRDERLDGLPAAVLQPALYGALRDSGARALAIHLVRSGWAVLEISAETGGTPLVLAASVTAGYALLAGIPRIDAAKIGLIGLGEGGDAVAVASSQIGTPAFVVAASGGAAPIGSFDPTSWWWTLDAPLLFVFGERDPRLALSRQRIDEAIRSEGILVTVEVIPGVGDDLAAGGVGGRSLSAEAARRVERWLEGVLRDGGGP